MFDPRSLTVPELLRLYRSILGELIVRGVARTWNAPTGDYAEYLLGKHFGVDPEPNSRKSVDVVTQDGLRVQVKSRIVLDPGSRGDRQLSAIRSWDFDLLAIILFGNDYCIWRAALLPMDLVRASSRRSDYVSASNFFATDEALSDSRVVDITDSLLEVVGGLGG